MKLSDKIVKLLEENRVVFQIERKQSGLIFIGFFRGSDREVCVYIHPDGLVNMYRLHVNREWQLDVYSLEECSDEEILFIKLEEQELNIKTHSEFLSIIKDLLICN
jgi:hypothetical protein